MAIGLVALIAIGAAAGETGTPSPIATASAYLDAMESGDLDAAERLFGRASSIFESGGQEGTWKHYREHHLGPEIDAIKAFEVSRGEPESDESADGQMAFVAWPIEYRIELEDRTIESKGTVTFVLIHGDDGFKIRHLHWSSRPKRR
jgi:ketosteroid isomerase-like protein